MGAIVGYFVRQLIVTRQSNSLEQKLKAEVEEAKSSAKEIVLEAKSKAAALFEEVQREEKERKSQVVRFEERLMKKEEAEACLGDTLSHKPPRPALLAGLPLLFNRRRGFMNTPSFS